MRVYCGEIKTTQILELNEAGGGGRENKTGHLV